MFRVVGLGRRRAGTSHQECIRHWVEVHALIARELPGLLEYTVADLGPDLDGRPSAWDGMATLSFESREAYLGAMSSDAYARVTADGAYLRARPLVFVEDEHRIV